MAENRNFYEILGVSKTATADEIKSAYRKAAIKWHPDKWASGTDEEKKTAEEKFKDASAAYSVLSDPDKRAKYDRFGEAGLGGQGAPDFSGGFGGLDDILRDLFGGSFGGFSGFGGFGGFGNASSGQQKRTFRGRDIRTRVKLTLEEIANGVEKEVTIERNEPCPDCGGKGTKNSSDIKTCPHCNGSGQEQRISQSLFGQTISYTTCSHCGGTGQIVSNPCRSCNGSGLVRKRVTLKVKIPAGVEDGMQLTMRGEGHAAQNNGVRGDLLILIEELPHANFKRNGNNLFFTKILTVPEAILGTEVKIPCIDGTYSTKVDPGTQSGTIVKLRGRGLPSVNGYGSGRGDLYVKFLVWIPKKLDRDEKEALEKMKDSDSFEPKLSREDKALFDRMRENF